MRSCTYRAGQTLGVPDGICVVITRTADVPGPLRYEGQLLVDENPPPCSTRTQRSTADVQPGDVLWDPETGFEVRCTRAGNGLLTLGERPMLRRG